MHIPSVADKIATLRATSSITADSTSMSEGGEDTATFPRWYKKEEDINNSNYTGEQGSA